MSTRTNRIITPLIVVFVLVTTAPTFAGQIIYVDDDGPADFSNIQAAINDANNGDTIIVAEGRYFENVNFNGRNITLTSTDPCSPDVVAATIIDGSQNGSVVTFNSGEDANCVLNGFTITNGNAEYGGGIYCEASSPTIANCTFSSNSAIWGGGMNNGYSNAVVVNCKFIGNSAEWGGGMLNSESSPTLTNCTFSSNSANWGGGMNNGYSNAVVVNCKFIGNSAKWGGGMDNHKGNLTITKCMFSSNSANWGGGMLNSESILTLSNCTFTNNSAVNSGMWGGNGVGIYALDSSVRLLNCILWGNSDINGMYESSQIYANEQIVVNYSCIQGLTGVLGGIGNIDDDPCFVEPGYWDPNGTPADANDDVWVDGDYHLLPDSPCIDAGDPDYVAGPNETDFDGNPRVINGRIDMGAYEYIQAYVRIVPHTINLSSKGKSITCYIWLPDEYDVADIEPNSVFLENEIKPEEFSADQQKQVAIAKFNREDVQAILEEGDIELKITCQLADGTVFEGTDTIKVTDKASKKTAE